MVSHPRPEGEAQAEAVARPADALHNAEPAHLAGHPEPDARSAGHPEPDPRPAGHPDPDPDLAAGAPAADEPAPGSPGSPFRSVAWELLDGEPSAEAAELRIGFSLVGRHESLARVDVRETASQVFVTVLARFDPPEGGWFAYAEAHQATIALQAPLGDRALVHAPADEPAPRRPA